MRSTWKSNLYLPADRPVFVLRRGLGAGIIPTEDPIRVPGGRTNARAMHTATGHGDLWADRRYHRRGTDTRTAAGIASAAEGLRRQTAARPRHARGGQIERRLGPAKRGNGPFGGGRLARRSAGDGPVLPQA